LGMNEMLDLSKYRIVDLSTRCSQGKQREGWNRRLELKRSTIPYDNTIMHEINTVSHIGTHVEGPSHYLAKLKDISQLPIELFIGEAVLLCLTGMKPNQEVKSMDLAKNGRLRRGDIALLRVKDWFAQEERPYLSVDGAKWLVKRGVKLIGIDRTLRLEKPGAKAPNNLPVHDVLLRKGIPIIEFLENLDKLRRKRFILIALPLRIVGLDASPVRAIAMERNK